MHELGRLIASIQERNDWSDRDLQLHAEQLGHSALSKPNFSRWRNSPVNSIKGSNIRDMAAVLGTSETMVAQAALESIGIQAHMPDDSSIDTALSLHPDLGARDKNLVRALLGAMSQSEERDGSGSAAPMNHAGGDPAGEQHDQHDTTTASAVGDGAPEAERGTDAPGPAANAEQMRKVVRAWGITPEPEGDDVPDWTTMAAYRQRTPGMAQRDAIDGAGEESQAPADDEDGGA